MAYCGPRGIALSTFLAWPVEDQEAALAWQLHEGERCSCGAHEHDPPGTWQAVAVHCSGHAQLAAAERAADSKSPGMVVRLVRRPTPTVTPI